MQTQPLWTGLSLLPALDARVLGTMPGAVGGISIDTRTLQPGDLFFALQGEHRDGHAFVEGAIAKGAAAAVVAESRLDELNGHWPLYVVNDVLRSLEGLGRAARARGNARVVAVTGSVGKTSTKEMLRHVLARQGPTHASVASYNNHWGVPLTLARMPADTRYGVFEIGMNHPFEILPLVGMVRPEVAIVTTVEPVHLEFFKSISGIADAKGEIFAGLQHGGVAVINVDNPHAARLRAHAGAGRAGRIIGFGRGDQADVRLERIKTMPDRSMVEARVFGRPVAYQLGMPGEHMALNSLAVLAAAEALGADLALAALALATVAAGSGRGQQTLHETPDGPFAMLDESYNANPASMRAALALLAQMNVGLRGRRIAILGDMLELGPDGPRMHAELAEAVIQHGIDICYVCGPLMRHLWQNLPSDRRGAYAESAAALLDSVVDQIHAGDAVMIKGSLGSRMGPIVQALKARHPATAIPAE